jgi:hypothetical protein
MGVYWENGSLYRKSADNTEQKFFLPPPFPTLPGVVSWGDPFILPEGDCIFFCRTSLYGNEGQFFGQSFLELDLKKILSPVFRFKKRFPEYKIYFIPGNGNLLCVGERALSFLDEDSENPFYNGKIIRNILEKLNGSGRPLMKLFLNGGRCYAAAASLPVAEAFLLLLIEEKVIRKDFDGSFPGFYDGNNEKSFSYQIF